MRPGAVVHEGVGDGNHRQQVLGGEAARKLPPDVVGQFWLLLWVDPRHLHLLTIIALIIAMFNRRRHCNGTWPSLMHQIIRKGCCLDQWIYNKHTSIGVVL